MVITGASAGIGKALAEALHARGAKLALAARRLDRIQALNQQLGGGHLAIQADVSDRAACESLIQQAVDRFGRLDTLVCNAGYGILRPVDQSTREEILQMFATNVLGTTDCVHAAVPVMKKQEPRGGWRGQVMMVSSIVARRGLPFYGVYSATKAAQLSLAEAMRVELKRDQIAVTSVHPIGTETEFGDAARKAAGHNLGIKEIPGEYRQTAETVARKMVRGIEKPRPEVWPCGPYRYGVGLATMVPGFVDRVVGKRVVTEEVRRNS